MLDALHLDPRATVADVGAGTGYFTLRLARRVARVLATDLQPEMLERLAASAAAAHLTNIEPLRAGEHDCALPPGCCFASSSRSSSCPTSAIFQPSSP